jgi:hypothetical protein
VATAGYSGTPLLKKLGIQENMKLWVLHPPGNYADLLEKDISAQLCKKNQVPDFIQLFAANKKIFEQEMNMLQPAWANNTSVILWVSWYKKSSGMHTDLTEDMIRQYALAHGLVDVKVCAVSDQWSGLKLVVRLADRKKQQLLHR